MVFTETPKTLALTHFRQSVFGSWIHFLQNDPIIKNQKFQPNDQSLVVTPMYLPDREVHLALPTVIVHRLEEEFETARINNTFQIFNQIVDGEEKQTRVYALRLCGTYQFDVLSRDLPTQFKITGYLDNKFQGTDKYNEAGVQLPGVKINTVKSFMVKDLSQRTTLDQDIDTLPDTDVRVMWRPMKVKSKESIGFEKEMEQFTYTVEWWCDLWYYENDDIITSIKVTETRF